MPTSLKIASALPFQWKTWLKRDFACTKQFIFYLFKARPDLEGDVDEDGTNVAFVNLRHDAGQPAHGLNGDVILRVLLVIHASHHGREDRGGVLLHLHRSDQ